MKAEIIGRFTHIFGEVKIKREGADVWVQARKGFTVAEGDVVKTGKTGRAEITFGSGEVMRMVENSEVEISQVLITETRSFIRRIFLKIGKFYFEMKRKLSIRTPTVETPTAVVGVRGTEFGIKVKYLGKQETEVFCFEGKVWVRDIKEEKEVVLEQYMMTTVQYQSFPSQPQRMEQYQAMEWSGWISGGKMFQIQKMKGLPPMKQELPPMK